VVRHAKFRGLTLATLVTALMFIVGVPSATAVHDLGLFELDYVTSPVAQGDANVTDNGKVGAIGGDDWDKVYAGTSGAFATTFVEDGYRTTIPNADTARFEASFYTGGGSKDTNGIQDGPWIYDTTNDQVPDADDIVDAFAAAYEDPGTGDTIFYFGADRLDWDGDKEIGFWFFRQPVGLGPVGEAGAGQGYFTYEHTDGDVLVLANFRNGGQVGEVTVYRWSGDDDTGSLVLVEDHLQADCAVTSGPDEFCAVINNATGENPPWAYINKDGTGSYDGEGALFEGGLNVSDVLFPNGGEIGCFSSFLAATRSSHSETAQLKDFALGNFPVCGIDVTKTGDGLSKVGDPVDYTITVENTGQVTLHADDITDTLLGDLLDPLNPYVTNSTCGASLAGGATCTISATRTVLAGDPDPLPNTVTIDYNELADFSGLSFTADDDHSVNLFQPGITIDKECTNLSKIGDRVDCSVDIKNTSSADAPNLVIDKISDTVQGDLTQAANYDSSTCGASLASNGACKITYHYTVPANASDPYPNTVTVESHPSGFPNDIDASDSDSVNLFQPEVDVEKDCDDYTKATDTLACTITITNKSSDDTPDLIMGQVKDKLVKTSNGDTVVDLGDLLDPANTYVTNSTCTATLVDDASCSIDVKVTVPELSPTPDLTNKVSVLYHPDGFPNDIADNDSVNIDTLHPAYTVTKDCKAGTEPVPQEGPAVFTIVITNTGDADLVIEADDGIGTINLAAGASQSFSDSIAGPFSGQATVDNTVHTKAKLAAKYGLPNEYLKDANGDCRVGSRVNVVKTTQGGNAPVGGWTFTLYSGPDGFDSGTLLKTDNTPPDTLDFDNLNLDPTKTYTVCEENVPAGWTSIWKVDTNGDGTADTIINPYNPNADDNPAQDLGNRCIDFGAGTDFPLSAGKTLVFQVDNSFPGGEPRTPGYWKNWSSCTGGNQYANAIAKGGGAAGFWTLDELLNNPGFLIGDMKVNGVWNDAGDLFLLPTPKNNDCVEAVRILDKSDAKDGKKRANDAAYELATALFAAKLNLAAGAETCQAVQDAVNAGQALLANNPNDPVPGINFTGTGSYLPSTVKNGLAVLRTKALQLATTLDNYNNGNLC
jgi:uncharacterized repeat protein (TIGR01451 family)